MAEHGPHEEVDLRVQAYSDLKLTGFEDESTRRLIESRQFLRQSGMPSLRPILPALLNLKGKPYTLDDYFPFEPFFRTHLPKILMLKTGRQVSKCCDVNELVLMADGSWKRAGQIRVGDMVVSWSPKQECFVVRRVTKIWQTGVRGVRRLITRSGLSVRVTPEHRLFGRDADNHIEAYCQVEWIYAGDYLAIRTDGGDLRFDRVDKNFEDGVAETVDIEVDGGTGEDPNFVLNRIVSHNSTSLAAQGIVLSNSMPHRSTLYVTPLFEMIRRFSHNYVRKFIEDSPVKRLFISQSTTNQILQRSFINGASMYFSYAFLDADRTRGIPADINCLVTGTPVEHADGRLVPIEQVAVGADVVSADKNGTITLDRITSKIYQGVQRVYSVTFDNGKTVTCTADERFLADTGRWVHLSELFDGPAPTLVGQSARLVPAADALRLFTRRLDGDKVESDIVFADRLPARRETGSLLPAQGETFGGLRFDFGETCTERRLGNGVGHIFDGVESSIRFPCGDRGDTWKEAGDFSVGRLAGVGSDRLLDDGRRHPAAEYDHVLHARVLVPGSTSAGSPPTRFRADVCKNRTSNGTDKTQADYSSVAGRLHRPVGKGETVHPSDSSLQTGAGQADHVVLRLRDLVLMPTTAEISQASGVQKQTVCSRTATVAAGGKCGTARIVSAVYAGEQEVWDLNTEKHHAFFAGGVLVHNCLDEVQDLNFDFLQIIHETLSGSNLGLKRYAGTPKSLDNTVEKLWSDSSQAEWVIRCMQGGCNYFNVPAATHDLYDMIDTNLDREISEKSPGVVCAKCHKPLNPRNGRWMHAYEDRRWTFAGYHVPQIIMPLHYADKDKWTDLVGKMRGEGNTTQTTFLNEVCGESSDAGSKLVTVTDLKNAAVLPWQNKALDAVKHINRYRFRILAVDWGGGGGKLRKAVKKDGEQQRMRTSFTTLAVMGITHQGQADVIWGTRSLRTHDWEWEAKLCVEAIKMFRCTHLAHDFSNAGEGRLLLIKQAGFPIQNILNMRYHGILHNRMQFMPATDDCPYSYYSLDKSQTLATVCMAIKYQLVRFFQDDYKSATTPGLLRDFLALIEEKIDSRIGTDNSFITRNPNMSDDFAQTVNYGAHALWWLSKKWPNFAAAARFRIAPGDIKHVHPVNPINWETM